MIDFIMLKNKYKKMFDELQIKREINSQLRYISRKIMENKNNYEIHPLIPFYVVGCIHYREANFNFKCHLHNGDPLTKRTVNVPEGRPEKGNPPFKWEESALDALSIKRSFIPDIGLNKIDDILLYCEAYNGFGYYYKKKNSPYLWNGSQFYEKGKFVGDGKYNESIVDKQVGIACIIKYMINNNHIIIK